MSSKIHLPPQGPPPLAFSPAAVGCNLAVHAFPPPRERLESHLVCDCGATEIVAIPARDGGWDLELIREAHAAPPEASTGTAERPQEGCGG